MGCANRDGIVHARLRRRDGLPIGESKGSLLQRTDIFGEQGTNEWISMRGVYIRSLVIDS